MALVVHAILLVFLLAILGLNANEYYDVENYDFPDLEVETIEKFPSFPFVILSSVCFASWFFNLVL